VINGSAVARGEMLVAATQAQVGTTFTIN